MVTIDRATRRRIKNERVIVSMTIAGNRTCQTIEKHRIIESIGVATQRPRSGVVEDYRSMEDIGVATTGWAEGDENHQPEVWIAVVGEGISQSRYAKLRTVREVNLERSAYYAMQLCLKKLKEAF